MDLYDKITLLKELNHKMFLLFVSKKIKMCSNLINTDFQASIYIYGLNFAINLTWIINVLRFFLTWCILLNHINRNLKFPKLTLIFKKIPHFHIFWKQQILNKLLLLSIINLNNFYLSSKCNTSITNKLFWYYVFYFSIY